MNTILGELSVCRRIHAGLVVLRPFDRDSGMSLTLLVATPHGYRMGFPPKLILSQAANFEVQYGKCTSLWAINVD